MTLAFVVAAYALAFWQRPGDATSDTKIDLHVDPGRFLADVASVWAPTTDLGEVHSAQYSGYLWPMGPFFAAFHALGLEPWVTQRLWLGTMLALAAWGTLRLLDELIGRPRGLVHVVATAFFVLNPYVVVFTARTTITLLGYAALPWLLLAVHRGLRDRRGLSGWWWPAAFALIFMSTGGGVNAAVVGWMAVGPALLLLYEPAIGTTRWRDSAVFLARAGVLSVIASLWWIVPLLVHVKLGIDFLQFTEQPHTIWATNSTTESLRLMGYWPSYIGISFYGGARAYFEGGGTLLFALPVLVAGLLIPALALGGFAWTRRHPYAPFFVALVVVGIVIMAAGFPDGTPLRHTMDWLYANVWIVRFMRTVNKAAPLVALGVGGLLGLAVREAWSRIKARAPGPGRRAATIVLPAGIAALLVAASWPLFAGTAMDRQLTWNEIPGEWRQAGAGLDRDLPPNTRAAVLPGQIFAFYRWGGTIDSILPRLTDKPVAVRYETPYSDLHAADLLVATDQLVQQDRLVPGQLRPLLGLMGVAAVISATDDDISRSGAVSPIVAARALAGQGLDAPSRSYGPTRTLPPATDDLGGGRPAPAIRRYDLPGGRGIVGVLPSSPATIVDGSADGLAQLAAFGALPRRTPILYAGDLSPASIAGQARTGASVVITDTNRHRLFLPQASQQNLGPTLTSADVIGKGSARVNPFEDRGTDAQTVAVLRGARYIHASIDAGGRIFPEHRPYAALDGRPDTAWLADKLIAPRDRWIEVGFERPRDVPYVDVLPASGRYGVVTSVEIDGRVTKVGRGWTRVPVGKRGASSLRVRLSGVRQPKNDRGSNAGLRELRIPGVRVTELLRPPVLTARALGGRDLRRTELTFLLSRTTGDRPFRRDPVTGDPGNRSLRNRSDAERTFKRLIFAPAPRAYAAQAWVNPAFDAPDPDFDRLVGVRGDAVFSSSGRFHGQPRYRASSAFDGDPRTSWIGITVRRGEAPPPWIAWRTPVARTVRQLRLAPAPGAVRRPTLVRVSWPGGGTAPLRVDASGAVVLPRAVRARSFRVTVLGSAFPAGTPARARTGRAVGISTLSVPGLKPVSVPRTGALRAPCGAVALTAAGRRVPLRPRGTIAQLDAGDPLRASGCAGPVRLAAGVREIDSLPGAFSLDLLSLRSAAPAGLPAPVGGGRLLDPGDLKRAGVDGVKVALAGPSWLVLGESFNDGWRATCNGESLGHPTPIDGYANGWRAPAGCRDVEFFYAPQRGVNISYAVSAIACALLLGFLVLVARRRRTPQIPSTTLLHEALPAPMALWRAALIAVLAAVPLAYLFSIRSGPPIAILLTLALWRGLSPAKLAAVAGLGLGVVVPILYLAIDPRDQGGYNFNFAVDAIAAHWIGVGAIVLLGLACVRAIAAARRPASAAGALDGPDEDAAGRVEQEVIRS